MGEGAFYKYFQHLAKYTIVFYFAVLFKKEDEQIVNNKYFEHKLSTL